MSDTKTTVVQGPDGHLYEIPNEVLEQFAVPGEQFEGLRQRMASRSAGASSNEMGEHSPLPSGHSPPHSPPTGAVPSISMQPHGVGGVVLNIYLGPPPAPPQPGTRTADAAGVEGYDMKFDESGIPTFHTEWLHGNYVDKATGKASIGYHSHDPISGNAQ